MTGGVLVVCVLVELLAAALGPQFQTWLAYTGGIVPVRFTSVMPGFPDTVPPALTLVTHMFIHGGVPHLLMNMVFFWWIGRLTEWAIGNVRFLLLFLLSGICGGVLQAVINLDSVVPIVGASGGISGIFAVYLFAYARSSERATQVFGIPLSGDVIRALRYAALWIGLQLLTAVAFDRGGEVGIAIWAHIGGFLTGLAFEFAVVRRRRA